MTPPLVLAGDAVAADDRPVASANSAMDQRNFLASVVRENRTTQFYRFRPLHGYRALGYSTGQGDLSVPQKDFSSKIGKSSSPVVQRVIDNNKNVQQVRPVPGVVKTDQFNKKPVSVK